MWWRMSGSNRRPPACKAGALPAELIPLFAAYYHVAKSHRPIAATLVCENQASQGGGPRRLRFVGKWPDNAESRRLSQTNGGSGWVRTIDPRLIKTVL